MNNMLAHSGHLYDEKHRPRIHFTPPRNWINDPNGMVYFEGTYHLFYQYNPSDNVWDNMHWGHATSENLISWEHKPVALFPDEPGLGYIFSGCAVVDRHNSCGLGNGIKPPLVALFTHHSESGVQVQSLAFSNDSGENWQMHAANPVLPNSGIPDFRDPKVFWHEPTNDWIMVLAAHSVIKFYRSKNLLDWKYFHEFGDEVGAHGGCWECPDLFPLKVEGSNNQKWVLIVSLNPGGPNGGSGTQYFIGDFDGERFIADHDNVLWLDYGPDNYAGVTWSDQSSTMRPKTMISWMSNWDYANDTPTSPWRGAMTFPRKLSLIRTNQGLRLTTPPIDEFSSLRTKNSTLIEDVEVDSRSPYLVNHTFTEPIEFQISINETQLNKRDVEIRFFNGNDEQLIVNVSAGNKELSLCRSGAAAGISLETRFVREIKAPLEIEGPLLLRIIKDTSSLELFSGNGVALLSALYFVDHPLDNLEIKCQGDEKIMVSRMEITELKSIW